MISKPTTALTRRLDGHDIVVATSKQDDDVCLAKVIVGVSLRLVQCCQRIMNLRVYLSARAKALIDLGIRPAGLRCCQVPSMINNAFVFAHPL